MTEVVAALIWDEDRFLICQRPPHKARGLLWEFVGGKVEAGEPPQEALIRECREALAVTVCPGAVFMETVHEYPDLTVHLILFHAVITEGTPQLLEHNDIRWIQTSQIDSYDFCPADVEILARLREVEGERQTTLLRASAACYRDFCRKLIPTIPARKILGVRMSDLRRYAKMLSKTADADAFLAQLPHKFYEEDNLHGILISNMEDYRQAVDALDAFLPYVDNWATCDLIVPKAFYGKQAELLPHIRRWLVSSHTYTVRFAISMLMRFFLETPYCDEAMELVSSVKPGDYYLNMMVAWFFATALYCRYDKAAIYLIERRLPKWIHNKTIQKAIESYRVPTERKNALKLLKY